MKNALILHGTDASSQSHWFPWLKAQLESEGWRVWVPDLPGADKPTAAAYTRFLLDNPDWTFDQHSLIIGHSSGAVEILHLLQHLPEDRQVGACILAGSFTEELSRQPGWEKLAGLFVEPFDFQAIKQKVGQFIFLHSRNDPHCPMEQAEYLAHELGGELIVFADKQHFSSKLDPSFTKFPELVDIIHQKVHIE